jgi:hypothetical protein
VEVADSRHGKSLTKAALHAIDGGDVEEAKDLLARAVTVLGPYGVATVLDWWVEKVHEGWTFAYRIAVQDGRPVVAELRVFPAQPKDPAKPKRRAGKWAGDVRGFASEVPEGGLSTSLVSRRVAVSPALALALRDARRLRKAIEEVGEKVALRAFHERRPEKDPSTISRALGLTRLEKRGSGRATRGPGRPSIPDRILAEVARDYVAAVAANDRAPGQTVAKKRNLGLAAVRYYLARAREAGLLTQTVRPGKAGGQITRRAARLLKQAGTRRG